MRTLLLLQHGRVLGHERLAVALKADRLAVHARLGTRPRIARRRAHAVDIDGICLLRIHRALLPRRPRRRVLVGRACQRRSVRVRRALCVVGVPLAQLGNSRVEHDAMLRGGGARLDERGNRDSELSVDGECALSGGSSLAVEQASNTTNRSK